MAKKQLIIAVEGTTAMGPYWNTVVSDYLEKIIRCFCANDLPGQNLSAASIELSLVVFNAHGSFSACLVRRSSWTRDVDLFLHWLSKITFTGGGFNEAAIGEGLSEALMMFPLVSYGSQHVDVHKHCILVGASDPYPFPTPVYRPQISNADQGENIKVSSESFLADAETVAKTFAQCSISLSVVSPKQLPKLRAIYYVGNPNSQGADPSVNSVKNPQFLVLLSENFMEARAALSHPGITNIALNQTPIKMEAATIPPVIGSMINRQSVPVGNMPSATVKVDGETQLPRSNVLVHLRSQLPSN